MLKNTNAYFPALTGVRALAAYMVFVHHFNFFSVSIAGTFLHNFFAEMHVGVTMFFVLSGLLLTLRYADRSFTGPNEFYNYMVNRFAKIYPVYFIIITLNFVYYSNTHYFETTPVKPGWLYYIASISFMRGFFADFYTAFVSQSWSLTVEECFYILCPLFLLIYRKSKSGFLLIPVFLILLGLIFVRIFEGFPLGLFKDFRFLFNFTFFGRCLEFFAGMGVGLLYLNKKQVYFKFPLFTHVGLGSIILWIFILSMFHTDDHYGDYFPAGIMVNNIFLPITGIAVFFWGLLTEKSWIRFLLQSRVFLLLGKSSYCFYLLHLFIFVDLFRSYISGNPFLIFIFINILAILFYKYLEHPINIHLKKRWRREVSSPLNKRIESVDLTSSRRT